MHISCWPLKSTESRSSEPAGKVRGAERRHGAAIGRKNLEEKERAKMRKARERGKWKGKGGRGRGWQNWSNQDGKDKPDVKKTGDAA
jgi:hypothetical protein